MPFMIICKRVEFNCIKELPIPIMIRDNNFMAISLTDGLLSQLSSTLTE